MYGTVSAASAVFTVMRTSPDPARARDLTLPAAPSPPYRRIGIHLTDCATIGTVPPVTLDHDRCLSGEGLSWLAHFGDCRERDSFVAGDRS